MNNNWNIKRIINKVREMVLNIDVAKKLVLKSALMEAGLRNKWKQRNWNEEAGFDIYMLVILGNWPGLV